MYGWHSHVRWRTSQCRARVRCTSQLELHDDDYDYLKMYDAYTHTAQHIHKNITLFGSNRKII